MAKRTEGFDEKILHCAKAEFLEKGYEEASLRTIAKEASVSTSTIYTRYEDKEGLFRKLVSPAADELLTYMGTSLQGFQDLSDVEQMEKQQECANYGFQGFTDILYNHFDEFKLLVTASTNGLYREFLEEIVKLDVACTKNFLLLSNSQAYREGRINDNFLHVVSSAFYSGVFEIVVHDMERSEAENYLGELRSFYERGWSAYLI